MKVFSLQEFLAALENMCAMDSGHHNAAGTTMNIGRFTGGTSDSNFIVSFGVATLDGCSPCGAALHSRDEFLPTKSVSAVWS